MMITSCFKSNTGEGEDTNAENNWGGIVNGQKSKHGKRLLDALLVLHRRAKIAYLIGKSTEWVRNNLVQHELRLYRGKEMSLREGFKNPNHGFVP